MTHSAAGTLPGSKDLVDASGLARSLLQLPATGVTKMALQFRLIPGKTIIFPGKTIIFPGKTSIFPGKTIIFPGKTSIFPGKTIIFPGKLTRWCPLDMFIGL